TEVVPDETYSVRACTAHPIYENHRVKQFLRYLQEAKGPSADTALAAAGRLMYASHWSYGKLCALGSRETDVIVRAVRRRGHSRGLYGAKITGGGSGGTVAVLAAEGVEDALAEVLSEYERETGIALGEGDVMTRSSDGAEAAGAVPVQIAGRA
ncbi:MAG: GHMP kinase, partial [Armatimonadota bacterium]